MSRSSVERELVAADEVRRAYRPTRSGGEVMAELEAAGLGPLLRRVAHDHQLLPTIAVGGRLLPEVVAARTELIGRLARDHGWHSARIARLFGVDPSAVTRALQRLNIAPAETPRPGAVAPKGGA